MSLIHFGLFTDRYERLEQQYGKSTGNLQNCHATLNRETGERSVAAVDLMMKRPSYSSCTKLYEIAVRSPFLVSPK